MTRNGCSGIYIFTSNVVVEIVIENSKSGLECRNNSQLESAPCLARRISPVCDGDDGEQFVSDIVTTQKAAQMQYEEDLFLEVKKQERYE